MDHWLWSIRSHDGRCYHISHSPCHENKTVWIANRSLPQVATSGSTRVTKDLTLNSVLHVHSLDCKLLSISKLTCDLNGVTKFFHNSMWSLGIKLREEDWQCWHVLWTLSSQGYHTSRRQTQDASYESLKCQSPLNSSVNKDSEAC